MTTMFQALNARRRSLRNATKTHMVKSVNKDGSVSKMRPTDSDWVMNAFGGEDAAERAEARRVDLEKLNPGKRFVVVTL